jgi:hypothetical protein
MREERHSQLRQALQEQADSGKFPGLDLERAWSLIAELVEAQPLELFYVGPLVPTGYEGMPRPALEVVLCTPTLIYDCAFAASARRYDVSFLADIYRLKETWSEEESVEGPARSKLSVEIDFRNYRGGLVLQLVAYGDKADELHAFAKAVRRITMTRGK